VIIGDLIAPRQRARYQGYLIAVYGAAAVLGPLIGGVLAGRATILSVTGWRWVFLVNVPIGLVTLVAVMRVLRLQLRSRTARRESTGGARSPPPSPRCPCSRWGREADPGAGPARWHWPATWSAPGDSPGSFSSSRRWAIARCCPFGSFETGPSGWALISVVVGFVMFGAVTWFPVPPGCQGIQSHGRGFADAAGRPRCHGGDDLGHLRARPARFCGARS